MTCPVVFHDLAENELNEAAAYDAQARPGLGDARTRLVHDGVPAPAALGTAPCSTPALVERS